MRLISLVFVLCSVGFCNAGIVYNGGTASASYIAVSKTGGAGGSPILAGQTFTTGDTTGAPVSVTLYLMNTSASGKLNVVFRSVSSTISGFIPNTSILSSSASIDVSTISGSSVQAVTFTGFVGSLSANTRYAFNIGVSNLTSGSLNFYYGSDVADQNSFYGNFVSYPANFTASSSDFAGTVNDASTAVPEPGTLVLTGISLAAGGVFVWLNRRRKPAATTDQMF